MYGIRKAKLTDTARNQRDEDNPIFVPNPQDGMQQREHAEDYQVGHTWRK